MRHEAFPNGVDLVAWHRATRAQTRQLFEIPTAEAYYDRPIALRNPVVFYEGHLPVLAVNVLVKLTLQRKGIDEQFENLFARGIDPESEDAVKDPTDVWPSRKDVQAYGAAADELVERALAEAGPCEATFTILEHELMHQETLLYMFHELPYDRKRPVAPLPATGGEGGRRLGEGRVRIPAGEVTLGTPEGTFGWDNEFPHHAVPVDAFEIDPHNVTNGDYLDYIDATGATLPHFWLDREHRKGLFAPEPLPLDAPVYVTHDEAAAYARWKGARLPTEAEVQRAALGTEYGHFDFASWDPVAVGQYPPSEFGVYDLTGNGWEWTSSVFAPFDGFQPMASYREYSADFFDGAHYVLKGASPVTPRELVRPGFRNWFRPNYPYVFATFRCAR